MAESTIVQYPSGQSQYDIPFDYLARKFVKVTFVSSTDPSQNRELTLGVDFQFLSERVIELLVEPENQDIVQLRRFTDVELLVDFRDGSVLTSNDLTTSELQAIHIAEEGRDQTYGLAQQFAEEAKDASEDAQVILDEIMAQAKWGYTVVGSFELGVPSPGVTLKNQAVSYGSGDNLAYYIWEGELPKEVPADSSPEITGDIGPGAWVYVGYNINVIQQQLAGDIPFKYESSPRADQGRILNRKAPVVKIATWNVWGAGSGSLYGDLGSRERVRDIQERILHAQVDFCGLQEYYANYRFPATMLQIFPLNTAFHGVVEKYNGATGVTARNFDYGNVALCVDTVISNTSHLYASPGNTSGDKERRGYVRTVANIRGTRIAFYTTHMSYEQPRFTAMFNELIAAVKLDTETHIAVMGDFNTEDEDLFKLFIDEGFVSHNNKEFNTNNTGGTWYIDNIFTKGFGTVINKGTQDSDTKVADHKMFFVELEV
ncbi:predicted tail fiber protein [Citrobacter phage CR44b]|uniref:Predicted tail fiber protein n=1 Tax=Citrobacter phage CR44b TaxID=1455075 RepID=W6Q7B4_9CAUD|nr:tail fiber protein [Citrobacter phage CR44b]CDM21576.1 predicted tail fiber protein [Citrobacter phage CR44b]